MKYRMYVLRKSASGFDCQRTATLVENIPMSPTPDGRYSTTTIDIDGLRIWAATQDVTAELFVGFAIEPDDTQQAA